MKACDDILFKDHISFVSFEVMVLSVHFLDLCPTYCQNDKVINCVKIVFLSFFPPQAT